MTSHIPQKINTFFERYPQRIFQKHHVIARAGEPLTNVFYLVDGLVSQYDIAPNGNEIVVNIFKPGAFFPMSTALNSTPNTYFFEAATNTTVHIAPAHDVVAFLHDNPDITLNLLSRVYRGVDGVLRRMAHLMGGDAKSRLLFELVNSAYRFGERQTDGAVFVPLKENDIAKHSGLARETVSRHVQALKTAGLLTVVQKGLVIKDIGQLEQLLGSDL